MALDTITNGSRPSKARNKVYGRKRQIPLELKDANRKLFGGNDDNDIASNLDNKFEALSLDDQAVRAEQNHDLIPEAFDAKAGVRRDEAEVEASVIANSQSHDQDERLVESLSTTARDQATLAIEHAALRPILRLPRVKSTVRSFASYGARLIKQYDVAKLNEGSYSDCFVIRRPGQVAEAAVLKVIPFDCGGHTSKAGSNAEDFLREVKLLSALEQYHGFAQIFEGQVVRGTMHDKLLQAARIWLDETTEDLDKTIDPASRYTDHQISGVIEMAFAGHDLELLKKPSAFQAFDAFWMTVILIGKAEADIEFEHRDLHMSNICYRASDDGRLDATREFVSDLQTPPAERLGLSGLQISIIDYTHSRMRDKVTGEILFNPECPFSADELEQFRQQAQPCDQSNTALKAEMWMSKSSQGHKDGRPKYYAFTPKTNVIWLSHVLHQLTLHARRSKRHSYLAGSSAAAKKLQATIWKQLAEVLHWIGSPELDTLPDRAASFLDDAIDRGLLTKAEVNAFMRRLNADSSP